MTLNGEGAHSLLSQAQLQRTGLCRSYSASERNFTLTRHRHDPILFRCRTSAQLMTVHSDPFLSQLRASLQQILEVTRYEDIIKAVSLVHYFIASVRFWIKHSYVAYLVLFTIASVLERRHLH